MAPTSIEKGRNSYTSDGDEEAILPLYATHNDESTLPLYNSQAGSSSSARERPSLPDKKATPQEIRDFLTQLLVATRSLPVVEAQEIASAWKLGSGHEMYSYPPQMYRQLFGSEHGWVVCQEVKTLVYEEKDKKTPGKAKLSLILAGLATLLGLLITILATTTFESDGLMMLCFAAAIVTGIATSTMLMIVLIPTPSVEVVVDNELRASFFKNAAEQNGQ